MPTIRKKLNKSAIILLALLAVGSIVAIVLHFTGIFPLNALGDYAIYGAMWASQSGWNCLIIGGAIFAVGAGVFYWFKDYIIGTEMPYNTGVGASAGGYSPMPTTPSSPQQDSEVSIS